MLRLVALVALFAGFCWFGTQVPLGSHTLFGHLHAIAGTRESQDLFDGTRDSAKPLVDDVRRRIAGAADPKPGASPHDVQAGAHPDAGAGADPGSSARAAEAPHPKPHEDLTPSDRRHLRRLISSAEGASARP